MHGKTSAITHDGRGAFAGVPSPFTATRYHSLCVDHDGFPAVLRASAASDDGVIQGLAHRELPIAGVQFHPESVLTPEGRLLAENVVREMRA
jgi:anthranilate/para-aminobenzoate synthase component II